LDWHQARQEHTETSKTCHPGLQSVGQKEKLVNTHIYKKVKSVVNALKESAGCNERELDGGRISCLDKASLPDTGGSHL
jgi:hypothetical protein